MCCKPFHSQALLSPLRCLAWLQACWTQEHAKLQQLWLAWSSATHSVMIPHGATGKYVGMPSGDALLQPATAAWSNLLLLSLLVHMLFTRSLHPFIHRNSLSSLLASSLSAEAAAKQRLAALEARLAAACRAASDAQATLSSAAASGTSD